MIKGIHHQKLDIDSTFGSKFYTSGDHLVITGSQPMSLDLSDGNVAINPIAWKSEGYVESFRKIATSPSGQWATQTIPVDNQQTISKSWIRHLSFDEIHNMNQPPDVKPHENLHHDLAFVEGRLVTTRYAGNHTMELVEVVDNSTYRTALTTQSPSDSGFASVPLPNGKEGLLWGGDIYTWEGDTMVKSWPLRLGSPTSQMRMGQPPLAGQIIPCGDKGIYALRRSSSIRTDGELHQILPGASSKYIMRNPPMRGMALMPDGGILVTLKGTATRFARIMFLKEKTYINLSPKALGLSNPAFWGIWWSAPSQTLYVLLSKLLIRLPWEALRAHKRLKLRM